MKYIIDLPEEFAEATKEYWDKTVGMQLEPYTEVDYKAIEDEIWNLAENIYGMSIEDKMSCFGFSLTSAITSNLSCQEAKAKFEAWLKKSKILVGDEIVDKDGYKGIVTYVYNGGKMCDVLLNDGSVTEDADERDFSKTGRHFDEVEELLKKMKEN